MMARPSLNLQYSHWPMVGKAIYHKGHFPNKVSNISCIHTCWGYKHTKHNTKNKSLAFPSLGQHQMVGDTGVADGLGAAVASTEDMAAVSRAVVVGV